jgi:hypothetical protein
MAGVVATTTALASVFTDHSTDLDIHLNVPLSQLREALEFGHLAVLIYVMDAERQKNISKWARFD